MWTKDDKMYEGRLSCFLTKINDVDSGGHWLPHLVHQWLSIAGWVMAGAVIRVISACLKCSQAWRRDAMLQKKYWRNIREALLLGRCACTWSVSLVQCALPWWNLTMMLWSRCSPIFPKGIFTLVGRFFFFTLQISPGWKSDISYCSISQGV